MELNPFWAALVRRWYLTIAGVAIALALTGLMVVKIGPTYQAEGTMLLFPPTTTTKSQGQMETQGNPYLMLGGLTQARDVLIRAFDAQDAQEQFADQAPTATYKLTPDFTTSGPLIIVDVEAPTPEAAVSGLKTVMEMIPARLESLQTGLDIEQSAYITAKKLTADAIPEIVRSGQMRAGIIAAAVSLALMLFLVGLIDGLLTARAARGSRGARHARQKRAKGGPETNPPAQPEPPGEPHPDSPVAVTPSAPPSAAQQPARIPSVPKGARRSDRSSSSSKVAAPAAAQPETRNEREPMMSASTR
ncbi:hypothetical protein [Intrasporangium sp.]|uniref:hypothetical protein n=1 Tax=Intrasporangium sp. TaxID=1925024 RepID=UPI003221CDCE